MPRPLAPPPPCPLPSPPGTSALDQSRVLLALSAVAFSYCFSGDTHLGRSPEASASSLLEAHLCTLRALAAHLTSALQPAQQLFSQQALLAAILAALTTATTAGSSGGSSGVSSSCDTGGSGRCLQLLVASVLHGSVSLMDAVSVTCTPPTGSSCSGPGATAPRLRAEAAAALLCKRVLLGGALQPWLQPAAAHETLNAEVASSPPVVSAAGRSAANCWLDPGEVACFRLLQVRGPGCCLGWQLTGLVGFPRACLLVGNLV